MHTPAQAAAAEQSWARLGPSQHPVPGRVALGTPGREMALLRIPLRPLVPGQLTVVFLTVLLHVDLQFPLGGFAV